MDEELRRLDLEISRARELATKAIAELAEPQAALREAAGDHIESVAKRRVEASRRASVVVMSRFSDDEVAELRYWAEVESKHARQQVERDIEACDFWIPESTGLSIGDVGMYGAALVPRPKDTESGVPQTLDQLFEDSLDPLHVGLATAGLAVEKVDGDPRREIALLRAWRAYRESAVALLAEWADIDGAYQESSARFQEHRWEAAGKRDKVMLQDRLDSAVAAARPDEADEASADPARADTSRGGSQASSDGEAIEGADGLSGGTETLPAAAS